MSNNKKIITQKDLARSLGNKTPVQVVTSMLTKKHGKYRLNGSKAEKKIAKSACQHHIMDKKGNIKPRVEYSSDNKTVRCQICGAIIPTAFFEDATVEKRTSQTQQVINQAKMLACAVGADRDTAMYLTSAHMNMTQLPKVYDSLRSIAEKADRKKNKKKNKKKQKSMGGWYQS